VSWETVIGLEVHVQLATSTKLFCGCAAEFGAAPNTNVCPVCLGLPGALPVTNRFAVELAAVAAKAIGATVHARSVFARKNYFYPDLPKGYQITQFDRPLATGGTLRIESPERGMVAIGLTRLHVEEDAGKLIHDRFAEHTAVDLNRAGVPLAEIVSEPDLRSPAEARVFLTGLKRILEYVAVSDCNMEEGHLRVDANLSIRPAGASELGTKQEVKNMNSFAAAERALEQLRDMQIATAERGEPIAHDTYSAATGALRIMRSKEESHDYRYFPDPDLPPLVLDPAWLASIADALPELPVARRDRLVVQHALTHEQASVLTARRDLADYYESVVAAGAEANAAAHWVMGPVLQDANETAGEFRVTAIRLAKLIELVDSGVVSHQAAKKVFGAMAGNDDPALAVAERLQLVQVRDDSQLDQWIVDVLERYPDELTRLRHGEDKLLGFLMGQVMRVSDGRADPKRVSVLLSKKLAGNR